MSLVPTSTASTAKSPKLRKRRHPQGQDNGLSRRSKKSKTQREADGHSVLTNGVEKAKKTHDDVELVHLENLRVESNEIEPSPRDTTWQISKPVGGRMTPIDPVFSLDGQYIILTFETALQVYTCRDSLLFNRISLLGGLPEGYIVATQLSPGNGDVIYSASSDGMIWRINWRTEHSSVPIHQVTGSEILDMTVIKHSEGDQEALDLLVTAETNKSSRLLMGYVIENQPDSAIKITPCSIASYQAKWRSIRMIKAVPVSLILVGVLADQTILVATPNIHEPNITFGKLRYTVYTFDAPQYICCLDFKMTRRDEVDILIGCAKGASFIYRNILARLRAVERREPGAELPLPQKFHWHTRVVQSVKWFRDGSRVASGGVEEVLTIFDVSRSCKDFLPRLGAPITNISMSPSGDAVAIILGNNSCIVVAPADDFSICCYVSGMQTEPWITRPPIDPVLRLGKLKVPTYPALVPAALHPRHPSMLAMVVGDLGHDTSAGEKMRSAPLLQTFDLAHSMSVHKQALARTLPAQSYFTSDGYPVLMPEITHIAFSSGGKWFASVDQWVPPEKDFHFLNDPVVAAKLRRETYLNFWDADPFAGSVPGAKSAQQADDPSMPLVTRIFGPHAKKYSRRVLDLVADPSRDRFATVGDDFIVRIWSPHLRVITSSRKGTKAEQKKQANQHVPTVGWTCSKAIPFGKPSCMDEVDETDGAEHSRMAAAGPMIGSLAFSDDGSALFLALGGPLTGVRRAEDGGGSLVHMIDVETGQVRARLDGLCSGPVRSICLLGRHLVVLSADSLRVYDLVHDCLRSGLDLNPSAGRRPMLLAANRLSQTFAIAYTLISKSDDGLGSVSSGKGGNRKHEYIVAVFSPAEFTPLFEQSIPHAPISLVPAVASAGFVVVDSAARAWAVEDSTATSSVRMLQTLNEMSVAVTAYDTKTNQDSHLDNDNDNNNDNDNDNDFDSNDNGRLANNIRANGAGVHAVTADGMLMPLDPLGDRVEAEADLRSLPIALPYQKLGDILGQAPAWAMPSTTEVFNQVLDLIATCQVSS